MQIRLGCSQSSEANADLMSSHDMHAPHAQGVDIWSDGEILSAVQVSGIFADNKEFVYVLRFIPTMMRSLYFLPPQPTSRQPVCHRDKPLLVSPAEALATYADLRNRHPGCSSSDLAEYLSTAFGPGGRHVLSICTYPQHSLQHI